MAHITSRKSPATVKLYTLPGGAIFSPHDRLNEVRMVEYHKDDRRIDGYVDYVNTFDLDVGSPCKFSGSYRVIHHKRAAIVLDYIEGP